VRWDPGQYGRFADERARPFHELLARVEATWCAPAPPAYVVDLGCGPAELTRQLAERWPDASVVGVDSSPDMVAAAAGRLIPGRLDVVEADLATWRADRPVDLLVANAALHWVPGHVDLIPALAAMLAPDGMLAFQVPDNFSEPSHTLLRDLRLSPRWRDQLGGPEADRGAAVERPERYLEALVGAGLRADVWQSEYLHVLPGDDAVLEWVKGTALRPVLTLLDGGDAEEFLAEYAAALRAAYPAQPFGTIFPFRRTFAIGSR
jgi:trans-aconitate 2-methyltransferase